MLVVFGLFSAAAFGATRFEAVRDAVFSDPYPELPRYRVDRAQFGAAGNKADNHLLEAARRTLTETADLIDFPGGQKLFQPNGICFSGTWQIDQQSEFTGLYASGSSVPVLARASVMLDGTQRKDKRAFGLAVKLFVPGFENSLNVLLMHSMGGRVVTHVADLMVDNHPPLGSLPRLESLRTALRTRRDLKQASRELSNVSANIRFRSVAHLAAIDATVMS